MSSMCIEGSSRGAEAASHIWSWISGGRAEKRWNDLREVIVNE